MTKHVHFIGLVLLAGVLVSCNTGKQEKKHTIILANTSAVAVKDKPVIIQRKDLADITDEGLFPIITSPAGDSIPAQLDDTDGDNKWDELFFVRDLSPHAQDTLQLAWSRTRVNFAARSHIRFGVRQTRDSRIEPAISDTFYPDQLPGVIGYQHYQTDGPTWENDKVGFRLYLDGRNSVDVFGKTIPGMTPDSVGIGRDGTTENNYSVMKEWGTDILGVANSVGIGGISLLVRDSLARLGVTEQDSLGNVDTTIFKILSNGPVRSVMQFIYKGWKPLDRDYFVEETTSIWPGMYAFRNSVRMDALKGDETLLVGLVNSNTSQQLTSIDVNEQWMVLLTHDRQSINREWWMGMALILPRKDYLGYMEAPKSGRLSNTFLAKLKVENKQPVTYYAVACWELSDKQFSDPVYFTKYVTNLVDQLTAGVKVTIN